MGAGVGSSSAGRETGVEGRARSGRPRYDAPMAADPSVGKSEMMRELKAQGTVLFGLVGFMWLVHLVNAVLFQGRLVGLGVHPRTTFGLLGVLFAPFLHGSFAHLIGNTLPLVVLGFFVMLRRKRDLFYVSALSALVGGLGTWLIAPSASVHVGASVLVFGYLGYLLVRGVLERSFWSIAGSAAVFFLYGGALFGILPGDAGISWQSHLFGLLGGVLAARALTTPKPAPALPGPRVAASAEKVRVAGSPPPRTALDDDQEEELAALRRRVGR